MEFFSVQLSCRLDNKNFNRLRGISEEMKQIKAHKKPEKNKLSHVNDL